MNVNRKKKKNQVVTVNIIEQQKILKKAESIKNNLKASSWRELETKGKFDKNAKLTFISDDMLIIGCDIGSETHYVRAIDTRGRELSKSAFSFSNNAEGFQRAKE
ncbi:MAG: IS110 family transposase, partial [Lachnospiraceae bacterium]